MAPVETRGVAQIAFDDAGTHAVELTTLREHAPNTELTAGARLIVVHDGTSTAHYLIARLRYVMPTVKFWNDSDTTLADVGTDPNRVRDSWVHAVTGEDLREAIPASGRRVNACAVRAVSTNTLGGAFDGFLRVGLDEKYRPVINAAALLSAVQLFVADALEILRRMPRLRETVQRGYFAATGTVIERDVDEMSMIDQGEMEGGGQVVLAAVVPTAALGD